MKTPEEKKAQIEALRQKIKDNAECYKRVFSTPDGQAVLEDLRRRAFVDRTTYDPDIKKMGINEGRRSLFVYITNLVTKDPDAIYDEIRGAK